MPEHSSTELAQAVFQTLVYSDVFDYPLTAREVYRYLARTPASYEDVCQALQQDARLANQGIYFLLRGREEIVSIRQQRESHAKRILPYALRYGRILGGLPFIRMVSLTGSLAVLNISRDADFDYMLVTQPGRLWTARAFVLLFGRFTKIFGHIICPNLIISQDSLEWRAHDLYSARELCQMIPIAGTDVYQALMQENAWIRDFLPNAYAESAGLPAKRQMSLLQEVLELPLLGKLGSHCEEWEMSRKIARFSKQEGYGAETIFRANICQGNFDHHKQWVQEAFAARLVEFEQERSMPLKVAVL